MNSLVKLWLFQVLLVGLSSGVMAAPEAVPLSEDRGPIFKVLKADNAEDAAEIKQVIGEELPEGYVLEVNYVFWVDGSLIPRGYAPTKAVPKDPDGVIDGTVHHWVPGGSSRTVEYKDGERHGIERYYRTYRKVPQMECTWKQGKLHGVKKTYHDNGSLMSETTYEDGEPVGEGRTYGPAGKVLEVTPYQNGAIHGERVQHWPGTEEDAPRRIIPYQEGVVEGTVRDFYQDGALYRAWQFRNGRPHGIEIQYDEEGKKTRTRYWLDGDIVPRGKFEAEYKKEPKEDGAEEQDAE